MPSLPCEPVEPVGLESLIATFERHLRYERRASKHTVSAYAGDLKRFADFLEGRGVAEWREVTPALVQGFVAARHRQGSGPRSLQRALSAIRAFFRYGMDYAGFAGDPASGIRAPGLRQSCRICSKWTG